MNEEQTMDERSPNQPEPSSSQQPAKNELLDAIQALVKRLSEVLTGPEAQRVKGELEASAQDVARQIDEALEGPPAQALKDRIAALLRTVQEHMK